MKRHDKSNVPFEILANKLGPEDDRDVWRNALAILSDEFVQRHDEAHDNRDWVLVVGPCSHWVRAHNSRWNAAGGFIWPEGYLASLPEYDWSAVFVFRDRQWLPLEKLPGKNVKVFRVAIPARTARHKQAVIHTRWSPRSETVLYGFRKLNGNWQCVAASDEKVRGHIETLVPEQKA